MKNRIVKIIGFSLALALIGSTGASADFEGPFAPSNWTFSGDATSNSLSSTQMQITSLDRTLGQPKYQTATSSSYSILLPYYVSDLSFSYSYTTNDVNGSSYDMAQYGLGGTATNLVQVNPNQGYSENGTVSRAGVGGQTFSIIQNARDTQLGSATITITNFSARYRNMNALRLDSAPIATENANVVSCSPGTYTFLNGGTTPEKSQITTAIYTLIVDGKAVSRLSAGNTAMISTQSYPAIASSITGSATLTGASWKLDSYKDYNVRCDVAVWQGPVTLQSSSAEVADSVKLAAIAAKEKAWDLELAAAVAANFSKEAREKRKRLAALANR